MPGYPAPLATERQVAFLRSLLAERAVPAEIASAVLVSGSLDALARADVSRYIDTLLASPRVAPKVSFAPTGALASLPLAKFAVPASHLEGALSDYTPTGDLVFIETREFTAPDGRTVRYMRRLTGAPSDFTRSRFSREDALAVARVLSADTLSYIRAFGEHFTVCGKCASPLTDARSRARFLGPDCARQLGVA
jgi:hypothetical protein